MVSKICRCLTVSKNRKRRTTGVLRSPLRAPIALPHAWPLLRLKAIGPPTALSGTSSVIGRSHATPKTSRRRTAFATTSRNLASTWTTRRALGARPMDEPAFAPTTGTLTGGVPGGMLRAARCPSLGRHQAAGRHPTSSRRGRRAQPRLLLRPLLRPPSGKALALASAVRARPRQTKFLLRRPLPTWRLQ